MKKILLILSGLMLLAGTAYATHSVVRDAGDFKIKIYTEKEVPDKGENNLEIEITDEEGNKVTDAKVKIQYHMLPMDNMPPMNYNSRGKLNGEIYTAVTNLSMSGTWEISVMVKRGNKTLPKVEYEIHVP